MEVVKFVPKKLKDGCSISWNATYSRNAVWDERAVNVTKSFNDLNPRRRVFIHTVKVDSARTVLSAHSIQHSRAVDHGMIRDNGVI